MTADPARPVGAAFLAGGTIGALGGLVGIGGAEFRLPMLIGLFRFAALEAVIVNKTMSLVVVASALPFRAEAVPWDEVLAQWPVIVNLLAGSLAGAWVGADWATRLRAATLYRVIAVLLVVTAGLLLLGHDTAPGATLANGATQMVAGVVAGFVIGVVASLLGAAGGELLIPTLVLLFGADIRLAGSLSLAVAIPTVLVGFARYSRDQSFSVLRRNGRFVLLMVAGSLAGSFIGGHLLGVVPAAVLMPGLAAILVIAAVKMWRHVAPEPVLPAIPPRGKML